MSLSTMHSPFHSFINIAPNTSARNVKLEESYLLWKAVLKKDKFI